MDQQLQENFLLRNEASKFTVSKFTVREILFKYLSYLPLFIISIIVCVGWGVIYVRYAIPVYRASANMFVKGGNDNSTSNSGDLVESALFGGKRVNIDNEIELIKSKKNLVRIVERKHFNIGYYIEGSVKRTYAYNTAPIVLNVVNIPDSNRYYGFYIKNLTDKGGLLTYSLKLTDTKGTPFVWNQPIEYAGYTFSLSKKDPRIHFSNSKEALAYYLVWQPCMQKAAEIKGGLSVAASGAKTTILNLSLVTPHPEEGKDILNALIEDYNQKNVEDKNVVAANTIKFIDERLRLVSAELKNIEDSLNDFKTANQIIDIKKQSEDFFTEIANSQKATEELQVQIQLAQWLDTYMHQPSNKYRLVPSTLTLTDATLSGLIGTYNALQLQRQKLLPTVLPNNAQLADLNNQLEEVRKNILESLNNVRRFYNTQQTNAKQKASKNEAYLQSLPSKERTIYEIERQKGIKQALFVYLLQKKEETAISASSTLSNYQQVDGAEASYMPIEPRASEIRNYSILLGLLIPIGLIYIRDLFNDKVTNRDDIAKRTQLPIVGEISHVDNVKGNIVVVGQTRSIIAEQFRVMRSNVQFMVKNPHQCATFLVTSSVSGEGKSFVSLNTAAVLSMSGKKVALLEFDLRKMRSAKHAGEIGTEKGIANYLIGQIDDPLQIISPIPALPNLDLYHSGPIAPNPSELMMSERVKQLFDWLKQRYDFIVIDSAPVGLVSDSYALMPYADSVLYVVRQRYTFKRQIDFLEEIRVQEKIKNGAIVVNDVHMGNRYGYYGYGYGYGYGAYRYRYGYGYIGNYLSKRQSKSDKGAYFDSPQETAQRILEEHTQQQNQKNKA